MSCDGVSLVDLDWLPNYKFSIHDKKRAEEHADILKYLEWISEWFGNLKRRDLSFEELEMLRLYHRRWEHWIVSNYYENQLNSVVKKTDVSKSQMRYFGESITDTLMGEVTEDEYIIENNYWDTVAMHICVEFMNFYRILHRPLDLGKTQVIGVHRRLRYKPQRGDPPPLSVKLYIRTIIENITKQKDSKQIHQLINSGLGLLSLLFEETSENSSEQQQQQQEPDNSDRPDGCDTGFPDLFRSVVVSRQPVNPQETTQVNSEDEEDLYVEENDSDSDGFQSRRRNQEDSSDEEEDEDEEEDVEEISNELNLPGISYNQVMLSRTRLETRDEIGPTPFEKFAIIHSFVYFMSTIYPFFSKYKTLSDGKSNITRSPEFNKAVDSILKSYVDAFMGYTSDPVMDAIERLMYCLASYGPIRDIWLYSKVFNKDRTEFLNKVRAMAFRPRRQKSSMLKFQNDVCKLISNFNPLEHEIDYYWRDYSLNEPSPIAENYKIIIFHLMILFRKKYPGFLPRFVVFHEAWKKHEKIVLKRSHEIPIFVKKHPKVWVIIHKEHILYGPVESLLGYWIQSTEKHGIPRCTDLNEWPWVWTCMKYLRTAFKPKEIVHDMDKDQNSITMDYRVELDDETKEKLLDERKRDRFTEEELDEEREMLRKRRSVMEEVQMIKKTKDPSSELSSIPREVNRSLI